jgi:hypothetical protein
MKELMSTKASRDVKDLRRERTSPQERSQKGEGSTEEKDYYRIYLK